MTPEKRLFVGVQTTTNLPTFSKKNKMTPDRSTSRFLGGTLVLNSVLLGLLVFLICHSVTILCVIVDQEFLGGVAVPSATDWVFVWRPRDFVSMLSLAWAVTATCIFLSLMFGDNIGSSSSAVTCLSVMFAIGLLAACYFVFCISALAMPKIKVVMDMGPAMEKRLQYSHLHHLPLPLVDSNYWGMAAIAYSVSLFVWGRKLKRKRRV